MPSFFSLFIFFQNPVILMTPSKRNSSKSPEKNMDKSPTKKQCPSEPTPAAALQTPIRNRHLESVLSEHRQHQVPSTTNDDNVLNSFQSPILSGRRNPNNGSSSKRVSLKKKRMAHNLSTYAAKTPDSGRVAPDDNRSVESETPTLSRNEYNNNLKSMHEILGKSFNPKLAFNNDFIDKMSTFINDDKGHVNFKLIGLTLDAGTLVFTSKVGLYIQNTQKLSHTLATATGDETDLCGLNGSHNEEGLRKKKTRARQPKKLGPTLVSNLDAIYGKLETNIDVDPLFHQFSASFDVGDVSSMLMASLNNDPLGAMLLDSKEKINFSGYSTPASTNFSLIDLTDCFAIDLETLGSEDKVCPVEKDFVIADFDFNNRDDSINQLIANSPQAFEGTYVYDLNAPVEAVDIFDEDDFNYEDLIGHTDLGNNDHNNNSHVDDNNNAGGENENTVDNNSYLNHYLDASFLIDVNLMDILPANQNEFFNRNFLRKIFRKVPFLKRAARELFCEKRNDTDSESSSFIISAKPKKKKPKVPFVAHGFDVDDETLEEYFEEDSLDQANESLICSENTIFRWIANSERIHIEDDFGFDTPLLKTPFSMPKTYFKNLFLEKAERGWSSRFSTGDGFDESNSGISGYNKSFLNGEGPGEEGEDYHYEPVVDRFNIAQDDYRLPNTLMNTDEPVHVDALDIDYCRVAKKVNFKHVKEGMWKAICESTTQPFSTDPPTTESVATTSNEGSLTFSTLRQNLSNHISPKLNANLSNPSSFVALLHLCNDKNLQLSELVQENLKPGEHDYSDFVIRKEDSNQG